MIMLAFQRKASGKSKFIEIFKWMKGKITDFFVYLIG